MLGLKMLRRLGKPCPLSHFLSLAQILKYSLYFKTVTMYYIYIEVPGSLSL